jgi:hypothetical protein
MTIISVVLAGKEANNDTGTRRNTETAASSLFHTDILLDLLLNREDVGKMFLRNVG